jgi:hypothetical protein
MDRAIVDATQTADAGSGDLGDDGSAEDAGPVDGPSGVDSATADAAVTDASQTADAAVTDASQTADAAVTDAAVTDAGSCSVWEIVYDLGGSEFEISDTPFGAGDQVNTVAEPYDADDHVGPGTMVLRFTDVGGDPGDRAWLISYTMAIHFVVDSGFTAVETDLDSSAGPNACGITTGSVNGTTVAWTPPTMAGRHSVGQMLCTGSFCSFAGLPDGTPVPVDETTDQPLSDFVFSADLSSFTMAQTVIEQDPNATASWTYQGTEVSRQLIGAQPCLCP